MFFYRIQSTEQESCLHLASAESFIPAKKTWQIFQTINFTGLRAILFARINLFFLKNDLQKFPENLVSIFFD